MFIGFFSDTVPIRGQRRKPYMFLGTIMCTTSWLLFGLYPSEVVPVGMICLLLFFAVFGMIILIMSDALVVERVKFEAKKGGIQACGLDAALLRQLMYIFDQRMANGIRRRTPENDIFYYWFVCP